MSNKESNTSTGGQPKEFFWPKKKNTWVDNIGAAIIAIGTIKLLGPCAGILACYMYVWLHPKLGTWGAIAVAGVTGLLVAFALAAMLLK